MTMRITMMKSVKNESKLRREHLMVARPLRVAFAAMLALFSASACSPHREPITNAPATTTPTSAAPAATGVIPAGQLQALQRASALDAQLQKNEEQRRAAVDAAQ